MRIMPTVVTGLTVVLVAGGAAVTAWSITALPFYQPSEVPFTTGPVPRLVIATGVLWVLFALAVLALRKVPTRAAIALVLVGAVAIGGAAMAGPPNTSTDSARYAWDGIVQNAGISPYRYVPADPALTRLRTDWLFTTPVIGHDGLPHCETSRSMKVTEPGTNTVICTAINRATVPTIYPPMSELFFAAVRFVVGPQAQYWPMQLAGLLMSLAITALLLGELRARGRDPRWAALWAWCPLAATEGITNSHIDILGTLLLVVATILVSSGRRFTGGVALGAAIATKLIPVIGAPALLGRRPWRVIIASVATFALLYVPYVLASGIGVLGYLPGYLSEEGYDSGSRFVLLTLVVPGAAAATAAVVIIAATAVIVWVRSNPANPWLGQLVMIGVTLLVVTPRYSWYALLLVPLIAMTGRWEWLAVPLALTERLLDTSVDLGRVSAAIAVALILVVTIARARARPLAAAGG